MSEFITSEDVLGKDVIDTEGSFIGVVDKVFLDKQTLEFSAISVDKGLFVSGLTIGREYIDKVTKYAVLLTIVPVHNVRGKQVFDCDGKLLGFVYDIILVDQKNTVNTLIVKTNAFSKKTHIDAQYIKEVGEAIMLNVTHQQLQNVSK
ncbi:MAG: PRC-barrel domain-containing protein [Candidatus Woesearchaeota archaeon]